VISMDIETEKELCRYLSSKLKSYAPIAATKVRLHRQRYYLDWNYTNINDTPGLAFVLRQVMWQ
jgi:hypothetical protein